MFSPMEKMFGKPQGGWLAATIVAIAPLVVHPVHY